MKCDDLVPGSTALGSYFIKQETTVAAPPRVAFLLHSTWNIPAKLITNKTLKQSSVTKYLQQDKHIGKLYSQDL